MFQCSSENKEKIDILGIIEHRSCWTQVANKNLRESWKWALQKVSLMLWNFHQKRKKNKKLDCQKGKHKSHYNSPISLNNSKHNKDIYLTCAWGWWQINIRKMFTEVVNVCYRQRRTIFIDLDRVTRNKKLCILLRLWSFSLLDYSIL